MKRVMGAVLALGLTVGCLTGFGVSASAEGIQKDVVNVGIETDPADLSPFGPGTTGRTAVIDCLYETLGYFVDGEFTGVLAKDYELSEDETVLTFHLYENIVDQAGNPVTASDVVFSYNKKAEAGNLFNIAFVKDVEAVDDYTVQFNLNPPLNITNIANLVHNIYIVTETAYNASKDGMVTDGIVSTAHYQVKDYQSGYLLTVEKYDDYWQDEADEALRSGANVDLINYYIIAESNQRTMALESGKIDMCWALSASDYPKFEEGGEQSDKYRLYENSDNLSLEVMFNQSEGRLTQDVNLRKAIGYALMPEIMIQSVFGGHGEMIYDMARSTTAGFNEAWKTQDNFYQYDVEKAAELVAQSDYNGESLILMCSTDSIMTDTCAIIQGMLSQVGINVELKPVDSASINTYFLDSESWDMFLTSSAAESYVVQPWLRHMDIRANGKTTSFFVDETLQELLEAASDVKTSTQETIDAYHNYMTENAYVYGLLNLHDCYIIPRNMENVELGYKLEILPGACTYTE